MVIKPETLDFAIFGGLVLSDTGSDRANLCVVEWNPRGRYLGQISAREEVVWLSSERVKIEIFRVEGTGPSILAIFMNYKKTLTLYIYFLPGVKIE